MIFKLGNSIKKAGYHKTKLACYMGFITQAIAANFAPLLFLKFHSDYHISLGNIALISTFFFFTQLLVDLFCAKFVDHIGYRVCIVTSEIFSALGLLGLAFLPDFLPDPFIGIICSVIVYAIGSGLIEVLCSPIIEACWDNFDFQLIFPDIWNRQLEMARRNMGNHSCS